jgi:hypothetical protein
VVRCVSQLESKNYKLKQNIKNTVEEGKSTWKILRDSFASKLKVKNLPYGTLGPEGYWHYEII